MTKQPTLEPVRWNVGFDGKRNDRERTAMNRTEHLLICLAEECAEVQQAISKALRFGLDDGYPGATSTNAQDIGREFIDVVAVMEMLVDSGVIKLPPNRLARTEQKKSRVSEYMVYAADRGTLTPNVEVSGLPHTKD